MKNITDTIERIEYMEKLLETAGSIIFRNNISADSNDFASVQPIIKELADYYTNGLWLQDYTADENSLIPQDLKRGVLSQDTLHNLLCRNKEILNITKATRKVMKKVKITAVRKARYDDLIEKYENPIQHACDVEEGQVWIANGWCKPQGFCDSAWGSISAFVMTLSHGGENFYDGWMKNPKSAMISCNDGFRPVSFLLETLEEEAE